MTSDERLFERAPERIARAMAAFAAGGALGAAVWRGWAWGGGFAVGAAASWLNFGWLKQIVDALGSARPPRRVVAMAVLRYVLLGGGAYVILRYTPISLPAALAGLFVPVAAVIVEILFELVYART
jgi:ATP synthase I chain